MFTFPRKLSDTCTSRAVPFPISYTWNCASLARRKPNDTHKWQRQTERSFRGNTLGALNTFSLQMYSKLTHLFVKVFRAKRSHERRSQAGQQVLLFLSLSRIRGTRNAGPMGWWGHTPACTVYDKHVYTTRHHPMALMAAIAHRTGDAEDGEQITLLVRLLTHVLVDNFPEVTLPGTNREQLGVGACFRINDPDRVRHFDLQRFPSSKTRRQ